jgi:hypothetical protein
MSKNTTHNTINNMGVSRFFWICKKGIDYVFGAGG